MTPHYLMTNQLLRGQKETPGPNRFAGEFEACGRQREGGAPRKGGGNLANRVPAFFVFPPLFLMYMCFIIIFIIIIIMISISIIVFLFSPDWVGWLEKVSLCCWRVFLFSQVVFRVVWELSWLSFGSLR